MSLPDLTIPLKLPIDVPFLIHPAVVHFAVAIPVVIILLEFINLFFRKRALSVFSLFLMLIVATVMAGAYFTGITDAKDAFSLLSDAGKAELSEHKLLGIYLVYGSLALIILKLLFMLLSGVISRLFFVLILIIFSAIILKQGHDGAELVYKYGVNNQAVTKTVKNNSETSTVEAKEIIEQHKESITPPEVETTPQTEDKSVKAENTSNSSEVTSNNEVDKEATDKESMAKGGDDSETTQNTTEDTTSEKLDNNAT
jgi:uncharacterized membrane protein